MIQGEKRDRQGHRCVKGSGTGLSEQRLDRQRRRWRHIERVSRRRREKD